MADTLTRAELRARVRKRADMENSEFFTDAEVNDILNDSLFALYDLLVATFEDEYFHAEVSFSSVADQSSYSFASDLSITDFYKLLGVDVQVGSTAAEVFSVPKYMFQERNTRRDGNFLVQDYRYRLRGDNITFIPPTQAGLTFTLHYIPAFQPLATDGATFDGVNRWHEWAIIDAAIKMLIAEESDASELMAERARVEERIRSMAANRDAGSPDRVIDVEGVQADEDLLFRRGT